VVSLELAYFSSLLANTTLNVAGYHLPSKTKKDEPVEISNTALAVYRPSIMHGMSG
jgi:hypothetical protein